MSSVSTRFRAWVGSVDFAVTVTSIVVALVLALVVLERAPESNDAIFAILLAGVAVPNIFDDQWGTELDSRLAGAAWGAVASVAVVACYLGLSTAVHDVVGGSAARIGSFVVTWFLGIFVARAVSRVYDS